MGLRAGRHGAAADRRAVGYLPRLGTGSVVTRVVPSRSLRLLITGLFFAGTGSLVAVSPIGRRSGAHLNPAVTLTFWLQRHVHTGDRAGYVLAQCASALAGAVVVRVLWGSIALDVHLGLTQPGHGLSAATAAAVEGLMTTALLFTILVMVSSARRARWTPLVLWPLIAVLLWQGAP